METNTRNELRAKDAVDWWVIGIWIRLALAGGMLAVGGVAMIVERATLDLPALGLVLIGAALAAGGKRMAQRALDGLDAPPAARGGNSASDSPSLAGTPSRQRRRAWAVSP